MSAPNGRTAGLVLAAGAGRRYGGPKAPVVVDGERLVDRAVRILGEGGCDPVVVVLGAWVEDLPGVRTVVNQDWAGGMGSSFRAGLTAVGDDPDIARVVVGLVDLPGVTAAAVRRLIEHGGDLGACTYDGGRGHPVLLARNHWAGAMAVAVGDHGAREYLRAQADRLTLVEVGDVADGTDLDRPADHGGQDPVGDIAVPAPAGTRVVDRGPSVAGSGAAGSGGAPR